MIDFIYISSAIAAAAVVMFIIEFCIESKFLQIIVYLVIILLCVGFQTLMTTANGVQI